jgi:hypothetical protein
MDLLSFHHLSEQELLPEGEIVVNNRNQAMYAVQSAKCIRLRPSGYDVTGSAEEEQGQKLTLAEAQRTQREVIN